MASDLMFMIRTPLQQQPVTGYDSVIVVPPPELIPSVDGIPGVVVHGMQKLLKRISEESAGSLGVNLHHAEWRLTGDPGAVETIGLIHDCPACRAGTDRALAWMRDHPGQEMLAGILYWTHRG